jgi:hypothetical protein
MNAASALSNSPQRDRSSARLLLAAFAGSLMLLTSGCYGPAKGPTDPKEFIVQGKQWTTTAPSNNPPIDPSAPATTP